MNAQYLRFLQQIKDDRTPRKATLEYLKKGNRKVKVIGRHLSNGWGGLAKM